jgi:hypothetical protein
MESREGKVGPLEDQRTSLLSASCPACGPEVFPILRKFLPFGQIRSALKKGVPQRASLLRCSLNSTCLVIIKRCVMSHHSILVSTSKMNQERYQLKTNSPVLTGFLALGRIDSVCLFVRQQK